MAELKLIITGDDAKVLQSLDRVIRKQGELIKKLKATEKASRGAGKAQEKGFGGQARASIAAYAKSLAGVAAIAATIIKTIAAINKISSEAGQRQRQQAVGLAPLAQLAEGDPKRLKSLIDQSKDLFAKGGAGSLGEAGGIVFSLESAGSNDAETRALFADLKGIIQSPGDFARSIKTLITSVGREETGGVREVASKAFAASKFSPVSAERLLEGAARGGASAKQLGISDEALLAANAIQATATGSAERGSTQVASLLRSLQKKGDFKDVGLVKSIQQIAAKNLSDPELFKFFGTEEAVSAFVTLRDNLDQFDKIVEAQQKAESGDLVGSIVRSRDANTFLKTARDRQIAENKRKLEEIDEGVRRNVVDTFIDERATELDKQGTNRFVRGLGELVFKGGRAVLGDEAAIGLIDQFGSGGAARNLRESQASGNTDETNRLLGDLGAKLDELNANVVEGNERQRDSPTLVPTNVDR